MHHDQASPAPPKVLQAFVTNARNEVGPMAWKIFNEDWAEMPFGPGRLLVKVKVRREDAYGPVPEIVDRRLIFIKGRKQSGLDNLQSVPKLAAGEGINVAGEAARNPVAFAEVMAALEDLGYVLRRRSPVRDAGFEHSGVDLDKYRPKVMRGRLRFRVVRMDIFDPIPWPFSEIAVDLKDFSYRTRVVAEMNPSRR
jgi:hypothetical protein